MRYRIGENTHRVSARAISSAPPSTANARIPASARFHSADRLLARVMMMDAITATVPATASTISRAIGLSWFAFAEV